MITQHGYPKKELIVYYETEDEPTIDVEIMNGNELTAYSEREHLKYSSEAKIDINYCPMCGRNLRGNDERDQ